ncbi:metallophosphoesterase [Mycobacterium phage VC3]|nr:metallophosphoesterase [Mycobacterium phage VC3]
MSNVWFTADLHIGHAKVAEDREHWTGPDHDSFLAELWDEQVDKDDVVWILGDISAGGTLAQLDALGWLLNRPGRKRLVAGNHDRIHPMHRDAQKLARNYWLAFEHISTAGRIRVPLDGGGHTSALLSHFPYTGDHTSEQRFSQWRLRDEGLILLHGHTHSRIVRSTMTHPRQIHVGPDAWQDLVPLDEVHAMVNDIEEGL